MPNIRRKPSSICSLMASPNDPARRQANACCLSWIDSDQPFVVRLDRSVAFARGVLQAFRVHDLNLAAGIFDQTRRLQGVSDRGHAGPSDSQHLREVFLREGKV